LNKLQLAFYVILYRSAKYSEKFSLFFVKICYYFDLMRTKPEKYGYPLSGGKKILT